MQLRSVAFVMRCISESGTTRLSNKYGLFVKSSRAICFKKKFSITAPVNQSVRFHETRSSSEKHTSLEILSVLRG